MYASKVLVKSLVSKVRKAEKYALEALRTGRVEQEPAMTDRLLAGLEHAIDGETIGGVEWTAKTLTDRGRGSQESAVGADFMAVFRANLPDFSVSKGFLAQSKLIEPGQSFAPAEAKALKTQCERMLQHSPASFVFVYSNQSGIVVVPAGDVLAARNCNPHELTSLTMSKFYEQHFECFIGDHTIKTADRSGLLDLRNRAEAKRLFLLAGGPWQSAQGDG